MAMKKLVCLFLMLCLMAGCTHTSRNPQLVAVDSMLLSQPDSALAQLRILHPSFGGTEGGISTADRMYYNLLLGDACSKCYDTLPSDSIMHEVADFYDAHGTANEQVRAHYLLGCVYRDLGEAPQALDCYHTAIDRADTTSKDCNYRLLSRVHAQTASLLCEQMLPYQQLEELELQYANAMQAKDTLCALNAKEQMAVVYDLLEYPDSVIIIISEVAEKYKARKDSQNAAICLGRIIAAQVSLLQFDKARNSINIYESESGLFNQNGEIEHGRELYYGIKGYYYVGIAQYDSAEYYFCKELRETDDLNNRECAYRGMFLLYQKTGQRDSMAKYAQLAYETTNAHFNEKQTDELRHMQAMYNYQRFQKKAEQEEKKANAYRRIIYAIVFAVLLASYLIYRMAKRQKQKKMQELAQANTAYSALLSQYSQMQNDLSAAQQGFDNYRTEKEKAIQQLQQELSSYQEDAEQQKKWDASQAMLHDAIVIHLHKMASKACKATEEEWQSLNQFAIKNMPAFLDKVCDEEIHLTEKEIKVCILTRLQFIPTEMAVLLDLSRQRITNVKANANKKLFDEAGALTFDSNIHRL